MKDKKLQIFVSSTFTDLIEERQAAVEAILSSGNIPAGMELFTAGDESQMTVIKRWIDESDIYLLILGGRYGSIEKNTGKSYTQLEYEYALENKKPLFVLIISDQAIESKAKSMGTSGFELENPQLLKEFRSFVRNSLVVKFWHDKKDIQLAIYGTLSEFASRKELVGWIRRDNSVNAGFLAEQIARLTNENFELRKKVSTLDTNANSLYNGLTYKELKELLQKEILEVENSNLYDYLMTVGENFIDFNRGNFSTKTNLNKLVKYKIITTELNSQLSGGLVISSTRRYKFSEDGHNFYLKALIQKKDIQENLIS